MCLITYCYMNSQIAIRGKRHDGSTSYPMHIDICIDSMVMVACWEWNWLATNPERQCKWQHSPQFQDRSPDADSSGLPNTVEDADVEDSALENSLASSYWFGAWAWAEETWTVRQTRGITCTTKRIPNENSRNLKNSVSAQCSMSFRPRHSDVLFCAYSTWSLLDYTQWKHEFNVDAVKTMKQQEKL